MFWVGRSEPLRRPEPVADNCGACQYRTAPGHIQGDCYFLDFSCFDNPGGRAVVRCSVVRIAEYALSCELRAYYCKCIDTKGSPIGAGSVSHIVKVFD